MQSDVAGQLVSVPFVPPESAAASANIPVGQLVYELLDTATGVGRVVSLHVVIGLGYQGLEFGKDPAVEFVLRFPIFGSLGRVKFVNLSVSDEEGVNVPKG